ncbi:MAG: hypothetical protein KGJ89_01315 [Patescibacteria group bacterium]|nr:hypothetical protein [Patescibacteria group bacterium]MDE2015151.1 hypothetical protein [Patescibacteria group bacterium]MDE2226579.1 hypothetical protein [Patescibacteria group bacterium]
MKRIYYILGIVGVIALAIGIGYFLRYRSGAPSPSSGNAFTGTLPTETTAGGGSGQNNGNETSGQGTGTNGQTPTPTISAGQKFGVISQSSAINFYVDAQNNAILVRPTGQIIKVSSGNPSVLSSSAIAGLIRADFSYDGKKILAVFGDSSNPQESVFDIDSKSWQPLAQGLLSTTWSPDDYKIAYFSNINGSSALSLQTLDISNSKAKAVELMKLNVQDQILDWISPNNIIMSDRGSAFTSGSVWLIDTKNKTLSQLVNGYSGMESIWSRSAGMGLLLSGNSLTNVGGKLSLTNPEGNVINSLTFLTLPSKCTFDTEIQNPTSTVSTSTTATTTKSAAQKQPPVTVKNYLYCAVPRDSQKLSVSSLPDDYEKMALFTLDNFYKIDLSSGNVTSVFADLNQKLDAKNLGVFNNTLLFINRYDSLVYAISLK